MNRFFIYEEYGAKYELMIKDVATTYRTMPQWESYQKGFEALATSLASLNSQHDNSKKALTIADLLVKASVLFSSNAHVSLILGLAHSESVQISSPICGTVETNACLRLSRLSHGDRERSHKTPGSNE